MAPRSAVIGTDTTRTAIHRAARRVFARVGVADATLAGIAAEAGIGLDELRHYYVTEDELLRGIVTEWVAETATPAAPDAAPAPASNGAASGKTPLHKATDATHPNGVIAPLPTAAPAAPPVPSRDIAVLSRPPKTRRGGRVPVAEIFASALYSLSANKLRSALTMLGIIIGVGSVVGLLAIGNGVTGSITNQLTKNGTNMIFVQGASATTNGVNNGSRFQSITLEDAEAMAAPGAVPDAAAISPEVQRTGQLTAGSKNTFGTVVGVWPTFSLVHDSYAATGDFLSDSDVKTNAPVVVLGATLAKDLFGAEDPLGKSVRIFGKGFRVIGVMEAKGGSFGSPDGQAYVPISTALSQLIGDPGAATVVRRGRTVNVIYVKATSSASVDPAVEEIREILNARHQTPVDGKPDFELLTQAELLKTVNSTLAVITIFLAAIAGISLLVGGIGIMNIMLVSVTERTREIGIRKAIGATERNILIQFVIESVLLGLIGAIIGVLFGAGLAWLVSVLWQPSPISPSSIVVAVIFAMLTGLFFGVFPARRAARLKPIDALRYE